MVLEKASLTEFLMSRLDGSDFYLTDVRFMPEGKIEVEIDSDDPVDIDFCVSLAREVEDAFAPEIEDYDLELGSAGLTSPFKVPRQYRKNIGNEVEILAADGRKLSGVLLDADDSGCTLEVSRKVRVEGEKRPVLERVPERFEYSNIKSAKYLLQF